MRQRRQSLLSRAPSHLFNHISSFIVSSTIVSMNGTECGENTSNEWTNETEGEWREKKHQSLIDFPLLFVHCFDSKTKFYSTCRYSSRVTCTHTPLAFSEHIEFICMNLYRDTEWNDMFVVLQWIFIFTLTLTFPLSPPFNSTLGHIWQLAAWQK